MQRTLPTRQQEADSLAFRGGRFRQQGESACQPEHACTNLVAVQGFKPMKTSEFRSLPLCLLLLKFGVAEDGQSALALLFDFLFGNEGLGMEALETLCIVGLPPGSQHRGDQHRDSRHTSEQRGAQRHRGRSWVPAAPPPKSLPRSYRPRPHQFASQKPLQILGQLLSGAVTLLRTFSQTFQTNRLEVGRYVRTPLFGTRRLLADQLRQHFLDTGTVKRRPTYQQLVQDGS
ncbi:hypothetical protein HRbin36_02147 [bacterium HR36]|nr:hypothetical protein HRbin36_02147 [bacterium HR36]